MFKKHLIVFAYAFAHRKTQDFLTTLFLESDFNVTVLAAPFKQLRHNTNNKPLDKAKIQLPAPISTDSLCEKFGFEYVEVEHDNVQAIADILAKSPADTAIISGARIIKGAVIDLFEQGVINFHPGPIPQTSGLDSFFYTVKRSKNPGITVHFIDSRVDAGRLIEFVPLSLAPYDTWEIMEANLYQLQITALKALIKRLGKDALKTSIIDRPYKNQPLSHEEKLQIICKFPAWKQEVILAQTIQTLIEQGELEGLKSLQLTAHILNSPLNDKGWTPLTVAAYHQQHDIAAYFIELGADINSANVHGTTVFMYAKTKLLHTDDDYEFLSFLISKGADLSLRDCQGKCVSDYAHDAGDMRLYNFLKQNGA